MERDRGGRPRYPGIITPSEQRVLEELRKGGTNAEIAVRLGIGPETVKTHIANMLEKLDLADRRQLAVWRPKTGRGRLRALLALPATAAAVGRPLAWVGASLVVTAGLVVVVLFVAVLGTSDPAPEPSVAATPEPTATAKSTSTLEPTTAPEPTPPTLGVQYCDATLRWLKVTQPLDDPAVLHITVGGGFEKQDLHLRVVLEDLTPDGHARIASPAWYEAARPCDEQWEPPTVTATPAATPHPNARVRWIEAEGDTDVRLFGLRGGEFRATIPNDALIQISRTWCLPTCDGGWERGMLAVTMVHQRTGSYLVLVLERLRHNGHHTVVEGDGLGDGGFEFMRQVYETDDVPAEYVHRVFDAIASSVVRTGDQTEGPPW